MLPADAAASEPFQKYEKELRMGLGGSAPPDVSLSVPWSPWELSSEPRGSWPRDALPFPSGRGPTSATDSSVTAAMPGMWPPPPKWRPAARAGSIVSAPARKGRESSPGLGREGPGNPQCCPAPAQHLSWHLGVALEQPPTSHPSCPFLVPL